jgi:hypothetical protein
MDEMQWMALDFRQEFRYKLAVSKSIAGACAQAVSAKSNASSGSDMVIEEEEVVPLTGGQNYQPSLKAVASRLSLIVRNAWDSFVETSTLTPLSSCLSGGHMWDAVKPAGDTDGVAATTAAAAAPTPAAAPNPTPLVTTSSGLPIEFNIPSAIELGGSNLLNSSLDSVLKFGDSMSRVRTEKVTEYIKSLIVSLQEARVASPLTVGNSRGSAGSLDVTAASSTRRSTSKSPGPEVAESSSSKSARNKRMITPIIPSSPSVGSAVTTRECTMHSSQRGIINRIQALLGGRFGAVVEGDGYSGKTYSMCFLIQELLDAEENEMNSEMDVDVSAGPKVLLALARRSIVRWIAALRLCAPSAVVNVLSIMDCLKNGQKVQATIFESHVCIIALEDLPAWQMIAETGQPASPANSDFSWLTEGSKSGKGLFAFDWALLLIDARGLSLPSFAASFQEYISRRREELNSLASGGSGGTGANLTRKQVRSANRKSNASSTKPSGVGSSPRASSDLPALHWFEVVVAGMNFQNKCDRVLICDEAGVESSSGAGPGTAWKSYPLHALLSFVAPRCGMRISNDQCIIEQIGVPSRTVVNPTPVVRSSPIVTDSEAPVAANDTANTIIVSSNGIGPAAMLPGIFASSSPSEVDISQVSFYKEATTTCKNECVDLVASVCMTMPQPMMLRLSRVMESPKQCLQFSNSSRLTVLNPTEYCVSVKLSPAQQDYYDRIVNTVLAGDTNLELHQLDSWKLAECLACLRRACFHRRMIVCSYLGDNGTPLIESTVPPPPAPAPVIAAPPELPVDVSTAGGDSGSAMVVVTPPAVDEPIIPPRRVLLVSSGLDSVAPPRHHRPVVPTGMNPGTTPGAAASREGKSKNTFDRTLATTISDMNKRFLDQVFMDSGKLKLLYFLLIRLGILASPQWTGSHANDADLPGYNSIFDTMKLAPLSLQGFNNVGIVVETVAELKIVASFLEQLNLGKCLIVDARSRQEVSFTGEQSELVSNVSVVDTAVLNSATAYTVTVPGGDDPVGDLRWLLSQFGVLRLNMGLSGSPLSLSSSSDSVPPISSTPSTGKRKTQAATPVTASATSSSLPNVSILLCTVDALRPPNLLPDTLSHMIVLSDDWVSRSNIGTWYQNQAALSNRENAVNIIRIVTAATLEEKLFSCSGYKAEPCYGISPSSIDNPKLMFSSPFEKPPEAVIPETKIVVEDPVFAGSPDTEMSLAVSGSSITAPDPDAPKPVPVLKWSIDHSTLSLAWAKLLQMQIRMVERRFGSSVCMEHGRFIPRFVLFAPRKVLVPTVTGKPTISLGTGSTPQPAASTNSLNPSPSMNLSQSTLTASEVAAVSNAASADIMAVDTDPISPRTDAGDVSAPVTVASIADPASSTAAAASTSTSALGTTTPASEVGGPAVPVNAPSTTPSVTAPSPPPATTTTSASTAALLAAILAVHMDGSYLLSEITRHGSVEKFGEYYCSSPLFAEWNLSYFSPASISLAGSSVADLFTISETGQFETSLSREIIDIGSSCFAVSLLQRLLSSLYAGTASTGRAQSSTASTFVGGDTSLSNLLLTKVCESAARSYAKEVLVRKVELSMDRAKAAAAAASTGLPRRQSSSRLSGDGTADGLDAMMVVDGSGSGVNDDGRPSSSLTIPGATPQSSGLARAASPPLPPSILEDNEDLVMFELLMNPENALNCFNLFKKTLVDQRSKGLTMDTHLLVHPLQNSSTLEVSIEPSWARSFDRNELDFGVKYIAGSGSTNLRQLQRKQKLLTKSDSKKRVLGSLPNPAGGLLAVNKKARFQSIVTYKHAPLTNPNFGASMDNASQKPKVPTIHGIHFPVHKSSLRLPKGIFDLCFTHLRCICASFMIFSLQSMICRTSRGLIWKIPQLLRPNSYVKISTSCWRRLS